MDLIARLLAEGLREEMGGAMVVENKPGAATRLGIYAVRGAPGDGRTLLISAVSPFTIYPFVYKNLGFDPDWDVVPITPVASFDFGLAVSATSPITSVKEFIDAVKKDPLLGIYGVPGAGTASHFTGAALSAAAGVELKHAAYKGAAPLIQDLIGGHIHSCVNVLPEFLPYIKSRKVRILATTGASRSPIALDVPTFTELGFKGMVLDQQFAIFAPSATSPATAARLSTAIQSAMKKPEIEKRLVELGFTPLYLSPTEFAIKVKADRQTWGRLVTSTGFTADK